MMLTTEPYTAQAARWPSTGRGILAQFDAESVVVYQAYCPEIGRFAAAHGRFGPGFLLSRMSWIKTNFLWMMFRSDWATKSGQEVVLALRVRRSFFDGILQAAVPSEWDSDLYPTREEWKEKISHSDVRLQWDPDHDPSGANLERRAIQIGLRSRALDTYAHESILNIEDVSSFVAGQRQHALSGEWQSLSVPKETPYPVMDGDLRRRLRLDW